MRKVSVEGGAVYVEDNKLLQTYCVKMFGNEDVEWKMLLFSVEIAY
jgi:hypothetical protein